MTDNTQPEALRLADEVDEVARTYPDMAEVSAELRRQHARIAELEAQLESIGAGGVSGPLMGRASIAASAGEPVAWRYVDARGHFRYVGYKPSRDMAAEYPLLKPIRLYLHPSPPEGMVGGWIALPGALPEPGVPVLLDIGKKYPIRAMWAAKFTLPVSLEDDSGFGEHDERTDEWYCTEGWYEWNEHEETHWRVTETPRAWMPLPPTSAEGVEHG